MGIFEKLLWEWDDRYTGIGVNCVADRCRKELRAAIVMARLEVFPSPTSLFGSVSLASIAIYRRGLTDALRRLVGAAAIDIEKIKAEALERGMREGRNAEVQRLNQAWASLWDSFQKTEEVIRKLKLNG